MNKSNYVSLSGTLVKDAIIRKNDKGSDYVLFTLSVPQTGTKWYDYINCIAFSGNADIIARSPSKALSIILKEESTANSDSLDAVLFVDTAPIQRIPMIYLF